MQSQEPWVDPYLIAAKASHDSIIAYHTALELHNVAYTTFSEFTYLSIRQKQAFTYDSQRFRPVVQPKALLNTNQIRYGISSMMRGGVSIKLTTLERSIVDVLSRPDLGGGWEEIWRSFDYITQLDLDKIIHYVLLLKNATTIAKVGYFLEQRPEHLRGNQKIIDKLLPQIPKQPHYMNRSLQGEGEYIEKWQLIVPLEIINRAWEEPDVDNI